MTTQSKSLRIADFVSSNKYAWPGGYPLMAIADDYEVICCDCCKNERLNIATTNGKDGWCLIEYTVNYDDDNLSCANCGNEIESAYK